MDANVVAPVAEPVATAEPTAEDQALAIIANTGKASVSATSVTPEPQPVAEPTPTPTPTDPPTGQVPVTPNTGTPAEGGAQTPTDPTPVATSDGAPPVVDEAKAFDEALGLPPETVETTDVWREKASAATQEIGRIEAERQAQTESLSEQGYELVHVGDGKYQLATTDEYKSKFDIDGDIDLSKLIEPLSEAQRDAMLTDAEGTFAKLAKGVAKKVGLELLAKRPAIKASAQKALLTEHDTSDCYNSFVTSKRPDGTTPLYPDADKPEVQGYMTRIWNAGSPAMDAVRDAAMRDKGLYMAATELCYYKAAYGMAQTKERIRLAGEQANADSLKNQNEPIVSAGSSGAPPAAASTGTPATAEDQALSVIGAAKPA